MRLIIDAPATGSWNMSVDQAILETAEQTGQPTLRFYRWSEPTLSLGYFQSAHDRSQHPSSEKCVLVRRSSGGGAIVHDEEITYSLCLPSENLPSENRWSKANEEVYTLVHQAIVEILAEQNIAAHRFVDFAEASNHPSQQLPTGTLPVRLLPPPIFPAPRPPKPFLCFQRHHPGDVLIGENKIVGSAQRRRKKAMLQHGSLLWQRSEFAPELPGLTDLADDFTLSQSNFIDVLAGRIQRAFNCDGMAGVLSDQETRVAEEIQQNQFGSQGWTNRR
jgi:lipoate-protein ligase A